jgi:hypothetical protein
VSREEYGPVPSSHDFSATVSVRFRDSIPVLVVSPWRRRAWLAAALLVSVALLAFAVHGGWSLARGSSMDLISEANLRVGFYGASWFSHWSCPDGHDHWSAPYWLGILLLAPPTGLFWYGWSQRRS